MELNELKNRLRVEKSLFRTRWMDDPACRAAYDALAVHMQERAKNMTIPELGEYYGTKDRRTITDLLRHVPAPAAYVPTPAPSSAPQTGWNHATAPATRNTDGSVTVTVEAPYALSWVAPKPPSNAPTSTTWREGLKVGGDPWLHAEMKAGNSYLTGVSR